MNKIMTIDKKIEPEASRHCKDMVALYDSPRRPQGKHTVHTKNVFS